MIDLNIGDILNGGELNQVEYSSLVCDFLFGLQAGLGCVQNYARSSFLILYEVKILSLYGLLH